MFHIGMWRERLRNAFAAVAEGRSYVPPPANIDETNDAELANGIGTPLADAAARSDHLLGEIIELYERLGERSFDWYIAKTTTEAVLRNSFTHPRTHLYEYLRQNGDPEGAIRLFEDAVTQMRTASAPPLTLGAVLYNLALVRADQRQTEEALTLLEEAFALRPDLKAGAASDPDLAPLRDNPRFQELVKS